MGNTRDDIVSPAVRSAAPGLKQCPKICIGGISSLLLGGYTSESSAIYVQCQCPECLQHPSDGLQNLEEHVQHVTGDEVPPGNGNSICRSFLFFQSGNTQVSFKAYMKQIGEQYHGKGLAGTKLWLFRFDTATTVAARAEPGTGIWVQAEVVGYNEKTGEHEIQFADGSPLAGKRSKVFVGASHVHFGSSAPAAGTVPSRIPPAGLAFDVPANAAANKQQGAATSEAAKTAAAAEAEPEKTGTRFPSKRQAALAAPAQWAAAGVLAPGAKRAASAAAAAAAAATANGTSHAKKPRMSNNGSADAGGAIMMPGNVLGGHPLGVLGYPGPGGAGHLTQQQFMMFAAQTQQLMAANIAGFGEAPAAAGGRARRNATAAFAAAAPAAAVDQGIKTSRFRGVSWNKRTLKWQVTLYARGRYRYFGSYTDQEEAARAYDRAALVWKGPNAQLNYPASTYLKGNQKEQLQQLQEQAQQEAAKGNEPPPELPPGEAGTAALEAVAAQQEAAAAAAAAAAAGGSSRGVGPAVGRASSKRRASSGGVTGHDQAESVAATAGDTAAGKRGVAVKDEPGTDQAAGHAVADAAAAGDDDVGGEDGLADEQSMEEDEGTGGEDDQAAGNLGHSTATGATGGDVAGAIAGPVIYKKRRKRKAQGKLFTRKKIHKQDIQLQMPIYAASSLRPPPEVLRMLAAPRSATCATKAPAAAGSALGSKDVAKKCLDLGDQPKQQTTAAPAPAALPPMTKEEQVVAAATAAAAAAAAAGRVVGAAKRKPGRGTAAKPTEPPPQQQQEEELLRQGRGAAKVNAEAGRPEHSSIKADAGTQDPDAVDGAVAGGGSSAGTGSVSEGEGDAGTGAEDGDGAEGTRMRRSQRQAAKKAQKKTARRMASVVNARSDGLWARLMQRAGSDAESSEEDGGGSRNDVGVEQGDLEAMAAAAQAAGVSRDVVMNAHEHAKKLLESGVAMSGVAASTRGRGRGRGRGRRGVGKRGRPPGSGIAARMAELHAQFVALGGTYGNDDKAAQVKRESEPGTVGKPPVLGLAASRERRARRTPPAVQPGQQGQHVMEVDHGQERPHGSSAQHATGGVDDLGDTDAASPSGPAAAEAAAALAEADEGENDEEMDADAAVAVAATDDELQEYEEQQHGDDSNDGTDGVDEDDADVAALLLGLTGVPGAAAADEEGDEEVMPGVGYHHHHTPHQHDGHGEDEYCGDDQRSVDMDSWGAAPGAASRRFYGYGSRSQRERASNSKYGEEEWAPRSMRNRGRGRGRGRARGSGTSLAAAAAASSSGPPYYPMMGGKGAQGGGGGKVAGRAFVYAPKYGGGHQPGPHPPYWPRMMPSMGGKSNMPPWMVGGMGPMMPGMMQGFNPAAMAAAAAATFMPPGMWPGGMPGQQKRKQQKRNADKDGSSSDGGQHSDGEDQMQPQPEGPSAAAATAAAAFNRMPPPQMAQHFVQVMFMAFTTGQRQCLMEFQALYACLSSNPAAWAHVMNLLFLFGTQMGANIAAAGGVAPALAAAFNSMGEQGQDGEVGTAAAAAPGEADGADKARAPAQQTPKSEEGEAAAAAADDIEAAEGSRETPADVDADNGMAEPAATNCNSGMCGGTEQTAARKGEAGLAAADVTAVAAASSDAAPAVPPADTGATDTPATAAARSPLPASHARSAASGSQASVPAAPSFPAAPGVPGAYNPAAAAGMVGPGQYMRVMMGLPIEESEEEQSAQDDEDEEVARLAAGAGAKQQPSPEAAAATTPGSTTAPSPPDSDTTAAATAAGPGASGDVVHDVAAVAPAAVALAQNDVTMHDAPTGLASAAEAAQSAAPAVHTAPAALPAVQAVQTPTHAGVADLASDMASQVSAQQQTLHAAAGSTSMPDASLVTPQLGPQVSQQQLVLNSAAQVPLQQGPTHMQPPMQQLVPPHMSAYMPAPAVQGLPANAFHQPTGALTNGPGSVPMQLQQQQPTSLQQHHHHAMQHSQLQVNMPQQQQYMMPGQYTQQQQQQQLGMQQMQGMHMQQPMQQMQPPLQQQQPGMMHMGWQSQQAQGFQGAHMQQLAHPHQQGAAGVTGQGYAAGAVPMYLLNLAPQAHMQHMQPAGSLAQQQQHMQQQMPVMPQHLPQNGMAAKQPMPPPPASMHAAGLGFPGSQLGRPLAPQQLGPSGGYQQDGLH